MQDALFNQTKSQDQNHGKKILQYMTGQPSAIHSAFTSNQKKPVNQVQIRRTVNWELMYPVIHKLLFGNNIATPFYVP